MLMLNRAFFSLQSNWIPTAVALGNLFLNALLDLAFYRFGTWGIPLSTAVVNIAGTVALLVAMRRRIGGIEGAQTAAAAARVVARLGRRRRASPTRSGSRSTRPSGAPSPPRSSRWGRRSRPVGLAYLASCRLLRVAELDLLARAARRLAG